MTQDQIAAITAIATFIGGPKDRLGRLDVAANDTMREARQTILRLATNYGVQGGHATYLDQCSALLRALLKEAGEPDTAALKHAVRAAWLTGFDDFRRHYDRELFALLGINHFQDLYEGAARPSAAPAASTHAQPVGYLAAHELSRLNSGHDSNLRSAKFGPSALDRDVPVFLAAPPPAQGDSELLDWLEEHSAETVGGGLDGARCIRGNNVFCGLTLRAAIRAAIKGGE